MVNGTLIESARFHSGQKQRLMFLFSKKNNIYEMERVDNSSI